MRLVSLTFLLVPCLLLSGCIWRLGPGGTDPALFYNNTVYPNVRMGEEDIYEIDYDPETIEIVGWVQAQAASGNITGRVPGYPAADVLGVEDSDYGTVFRGLMEEHDLDGLLSPVVDTQRQVLNLFLIRGSNKHTVVGGVGFRFKERPPRWKIAGEETSETLPAGGT